MSKAHEKFTHFIFICMGKDCKKAGAKELEKSFVMELKNNGLSKSVKILNCKCTDRCKEAPVAIVNNHWLGNVSVDQTAELVKEFIE